jgi:PhzF family phenazine biosynthesis protein
MKLPLYQVDAFASRVFAGNPAAVVPLERWLDDATLQAIATENNLSETAFFVGGSGDYHIRWMTPVAEIDLCGHATLASASIVFDRLEPGRREVTFRSKSGPLRVTADGDRLALDFPSRAPEPAPASLPAVADALGRLRQRAGGARSAAGHGEDGCARPHGRDRDRAGRRL